MTKYTFSWLLLGVLLLITACSGNQTQRSEAQAVVDAALEAHGSPNLNKSVVTFKLRDIQYRALRDNGAYVYSRTFTDSTGQRIHDVLSNSGFKRTVDDVEANLPEEKTQAYSNSVNAVVYFALLPYSLNDAAVQKSYLGEVQVKGEPYHKVKVTFTKEGGGEGFQDQYIYWFHKDRHTMDYLAYDFLENGGGSRFREVTKVYEVGGVRFQDYNNYKIDDLSFPIDNYDRAFEADKLQKVSEINLEGVQVRELE